MPTWIYKRKNWHWMCNTPFYHRFEAILQRCNNKNNNRYKDYWGRWIKCEWVNFNEFYNDMYSDFVKHSEIHWTRQTTIERIDNDWNYCKDNCKWITMKEQQRNTRSVILYNGKSLLENCEERWIKFTSVYARIKRWWDIKKALETPMKEWNR